MPDHSASTSPPTADLADVFQVIQRFARILIVGPFLLAVLAGAFSYLLPREYRAEVMFLPEKSSTQGLNGALAGVAGQFGLNIAGDGAAPSRLYGDLSRSRSLLERLLWMPVVASDASAAMPFIDHVVPSKGDSADRIDAALRKLASAVEVRADIQTGVVRLLLQARDPRVAAEAANGLVGLMSQFNIESRQTKGRQRRKFTEGRASDALLDLQSAERDLRNAQIGRAHV